MRELYMKNSNAFVIIYSIENLRSFNECSKILNDILRERKEELPPTIIVGNKKDLEKNRLIKTDDGKKLANDFNCSFLEVSAKSNDDIKRIFQILTEKLKPIHKEKTKSQCNLFM